MTVTDTPIVVGITPAGVERLPNAGPRRRPPLQQLLAIVLPPITPAAKLHARTRPTAKIAELEGRPRVDGQISGRGRRLRRKQMRGLCIETVSDR